MKLAFAILAFLVAASPVQSSAFSALRLAYATRDANAAAAAYRADAEVVYRYAGVLEERYKGTQAIAASFKALFDQMDAKDRLDLNFRETARSGNRVQGVYRLRVGTAHTFYGRFDVLVDGSTKFISDVSTGATQKEFEEASGALMFNEADPTLGGD